MSEAPVGLRERKNERTRAAITLAAAELILERGFEGATIAQIAERADVAPRTVHTWFASKEDIVLSGVDAPLDRLQAELRSGAGDTVDRIERWMRAEGAYHRSDGDGEPGRLRHRALAEDAHLRALVRERLAGTEAALAEAVAAEAGIPATALAAQAFAAATISLLLGLRTRFMDPGPDRESDDLADGFALLRGALAAITR